jgi:hypothetical protein
MAVPAFVKELVLSPGGSNKTAGTALAPVISATALAGNLIVAAIVFDNAATASKPIVSSISKPAGETNSWVFLGAARSTSTTAGAFASGELWCINMGALQHKILTAASQQTLNAAGTATAGNGAIVAILQASPDPALTQASYRLYADGTESGSVALANQDTAYTTSVDAGDVNVLVRARLQSTNAVAVAAIDDFQLQWEKNASGTWTNVSTDPFLYDQNPVYSWTGSYRVPQLGTGPWRIGQSFVGNGQKLSRLSWYLQKTGAPVGTYTAAIFAHAGAFGSSSVGTGTALATSTTSLVGSQITNQRWCDFNFDESFTLVNGTNYVAAMILTGSAIDAANYLMFIVSAPGLHPGNGSEYVTGAWGSLGEDFMFRAFTKAVTPPTGVVGYYGSPNLNDEDPTTNRLTGGTGTFVPGGVSKVGTVSDLNGRNTWAANNYTELLFAVTLKAADLVNSDTLRFRVLRNGATTGLTYTQTPTVSITKAAVSGRPKIYVASAFTAKPLKVWSGSTWIEKPVKVWTGSTWKTLT